jgi:hypothetical protein
VGGMSLVIVIPRLRSAIGRCVISVTEAAADTLRP